MNTATNRYSTFGLTLHWLTAVLVVFAFSYGLEGSEARQYMPGKEFDRQLHETLGLLVLVLAVIRIAWRANTSAPAAVPMARWMHITSKSVQGLLYLLLLAVPLTAVFATWLMGHPLDLLGGGTISPPLEKSHSLGHSIADIHVFLGDAILWVAGLHAVAALYHHLILKDAVLASMTPSWLVRGKTGQD